MAFTCSISYLLVFGLIGDKDNKSSLQKKADYVCHADPFGLNKPLEVDQSAKGHLKESDYNFQKAEEGKFIHR